MSNNIYKNSIEIPLHNFSYLHHTHNIESENTFIGRKKELDKMLSILKDKNAKGAYLITGYRGCGKTSFINEVIRRYKKDKKTNEEVKNNSVIEVKLNLANDRLLNPFQIYKRMSYGLLDNLDPDNIKNRKLGYIVKRIWEFLFVVMVVVSSLVFIDYSMNKVSSKQESNSSERESNSSEKESISWNNVVEDFFKHKSESYELKIAGDNMGHKFLDLKVSDLNEITLNKNNINPLIYIIVALLLSAYLLSIFWRYLQFNKDDHRRLRELVQDIDSDTSTSTS